MKLGFISAILDHSSFEEVIDTAASIGYECVEVACWPKGKAFEGTKEKVLDALRLSYRYIRQFVI